MRKGHSGAQPGNAANDGHRATAADAGIWQYADEHSRADLIFDDFKRTRTARQSTRERRAEHGHPVPGRRPAHGTDDLITVPTAAIRQALSFTDDYLAATRAALPVHRFPTPKPAGRSAPLRNKSETTPPPFVYGHAPDREPSQACPAAPTG